MPENKLISELLVGSFVIKTFNYQRADFRQPRDEDGFVTRNPDIIQLKLIIVDVSIKITSKNSP